MSGYIDRWASRTDVSHKGTRCLQVHIVNSLRYACTAIETFVVAASGEKAAAAPAASARTIGQDQLPVPSNIALASAVPCLPTPLTRAVLIRTANEDWGILRGTQFQS